MPTCQLGGQNASQPFIPAKTHINGGWWLGCNHCGTRYESYGRNRDEYTDTDISLDLVINGRVVYCSADCMIGHEAEVASRNAKFEEFKVRAGEARADVTFTEFTGG